MVSDKMSLITTTMMPCFQIYYRNIKTLCQIFRVMNTARHLWLCNSNAYVADVCHVRQRPLGCGQNVLDWDGHQNDLTSLICWCDVIMDFCSTTINNVLKAFVISALRPPDKEDWMPEFLHVILNLGVRCSSQDLYVVVKTFRQNKEKRDLLLAVQDKCTIVFHVEWFQPPEQSCVQKWDICIYLFMDPLHDAAWTAL